MNCWPSPHLMNLSPNDIFCEIDILTSNMEPLRYRNKYLKIQNKTLSSAVDNISCCGIIVKNYFILHALTAIHSIFWVSITIFVFIHIIPWIMPRIMHRSPYDLLKFSKVEGNWLQWKQGDVLHNIITISWSFDLDKFQQLLPLGCPDNYGPYLWLRSISGSSNSIELNI